MQTKSSANIMYRYLIALLLLATCFFSTANAAACEEEMTELTSCLDDDCKACLALGGVSAWESCEESTEKYCSDVNKCSESCGDCMDDYKTWATCYVASLPFQQDCELTCDAGGRADETTSSATQYGYSIIVVLVAALMA